MTLQTLLYDPRGEDYEAAEGKRHILPCVGLNNSTACVQLLVFCRFSPFVRGGPDASRLIYRRHIYNGTISAGDNLLNLQRPTTHLRAVPPRCPTRLQLRQMDSAVMRLTERNWIRRPRLRSAGWRLVRSEGSPRHDWAIVWQQMQKLLPPPV